MNYKHSPTYYLAVNLREQARAVGFKGQLSVEEITDYSYSRKTVSHEQIYFSEEISIVQKDMFIGLPGPACKLILQIISELRLNNALWYFDHGGKSQLKQAIAELRRRGILLRTEDATIHFVNPDFIRRGGKLAVLSMTAAELQGTNRVSIHNIRALSHREVTFTEFDRLSAGDIKQLDNESDTRSLEDLH